MATAHDVASFILSKTGSISTWKLQKLVYYSQAWHLAWDQEPLFNDRIEAWANGPVVPVLYNKHRGSFTSPDRWPTGDEDALNASEQATVDLVISNYGGLTGHQLSALTHSESPWKSAREGLSETDRSQRQITQESMLEFYAALDESDESPIDEIDWRDWEDVDY